MYKRQPLASGRLNEYITFKSQTKLDLNPLASGRLDVYDNDNYDMVSGTSIDSFMGYVKTLHKPVLFFHNLKFDGSFIVWWLLKNGYKWSKEKEPKTFDTMINKQGIWYQISIVWDVKGRNKHETIIQDSLKKMPYSISAIAKNFGFDSDMQKLKIDYNCYRKENGVLSATDKEYLRHDVVIPVSYTHLILFLFQDQ